MIEKTFILAILVSLLCNAIAKPCPTNLTGTVKCTLPSEGNKDCNQKVIKLSAQCTETYSARYDITYCNPNTFTLSMNASLSYLRSKYKNFTWANMTILPQTTGAKCYSFSRWSYLTNCDKSSWARLNIMSKSSDNYFCNLYIPLAVTPQLDLSQSVAPTANPTKPPTLKPTRKPSEGPTNKGPTRKPTPKSPTRKPSRKPSSTPSRKPTRKPTSKPSSKPSNARTPTKKPTRKPTAKPVAPVLTTPAPASVPCSCLPYVSANPVAASPTFANGRKFDRIVIFIMENTDYTTSMSDSYLVNLTKYGALFKSYFCCQHPSYPNYLNQVAAQDFGSTSDSSPMPIYGARTIIDALDDKGVTWKNYVESGVGSNHNPFNQFYHIKNNSTKYSNIIPISSASSSSTITQFVTDWKNRALSAYTLYTSCCVEGQQSGGVPSLKIFLDSIGGVSGINAYTGTLVQIVYDESGSKTTCNLNQVYNLFLGSPVKANCSITTSSTPYTILRTIEENFGTGPIGNVGNFDQRVGSVNECWAN